MPLIRNPYYKSYRSLGLNPNALQINDYKSTKIYSQERPSWPSSFASQFKVIYPQDTHSIVEPESLTKATTEYTESISKVEPIFELEGEQIYELE